MRRGKRQFDLLTRPWSFRLLELAAPLAGYRRVKELIPWFRAGDFNVSCIPVNEDIGLPENTALPAQLLEDFIARASHRVIVDYCACRKALGCKRYPADIGCLMMGSSALEIHPDIRREVSVDAALEHARAAMDKGLVPLGKSPHRQPRLRHQRQEAPPLDVLLLRVLLHLPFRPPRASRDTLRVGDEARRAHDRSHRRLRRRRRLREAVLPPGDRDRRRARGDRRGVRRVRPVRNRLQAGRHNDLARQPGFPRGSALTDRGPGRLRVTLTQAAGSL